MVNLRHSTFGNRPTFPFFVCFVFVLVCFVFCFGCLNVANFTNLHRLVFAQNNVSVFEDTVGRFTAKCLFVWSVPTECCVWAPAHTETHKDVRITTQACPIDKANRGEETFRKNRHNTLMSSFCSFWTLSL